MAKASQKSKTFEDLLNKKKKASSSLRKEISESLTDSEKIYFEMIQNILEERRKPLTNTQMSSTTEEFEDILDNIARDSKNASLGTLKGQYQRIQALKNTFNSLQDTLNQEEKNRLSSQLDTSEKSLKGLVTKKSKISSRAEGFLKFQGIDLSSTLSQAAGRDKINAFLGKMIGGGIGKVLNKRADKAKAILNDKESILDSLNRNTKLKEKSTEAVSQEEFFPKRERKGKGDAEDTGDFIPVLRTISSNINEIRIDVRKLVSLEEQRMRKEEGDLLQKEEDFLEGGRIRKDRGGNTTSNSTFLSNTKYNNGGGSNKSQKTSFSDVMKYALEGAGVVTIVESVLGALGVGSVIAAAGPVVATLAAGVISAVVVSKLLEKYGGAFKRGLNIIGDGLKDVIQHDIIGSLKELGDDFKHFYNKQTYQLTEEDHKKDFIKDSEALREEKLKLMRLEEKQKAAGAPINESGIKNSKEKINELNSKIIDYVKTNGGTPESITREYNQAAMVKGDKLAKPKDLGFHSAEPPIEPSLPKVSTNAPVLMSSTENSQKLINPNLAGNALGYVTEKFESSGKGPGVISTDINGKNSYGSWQLNGAGTVQDFVNKTKYRSTFQGLKANSDEFNQKWKEVAQSDPTFKQEQFDYMKKYQYGPMLKKLQKDGIDLSGKGLPVQQALFSTVTQHGIGGGAGVIKNSLKGQDIQSMSDNDVVSTIQDYKIKNVEGLWSKNKDPKYRNNLINRLQEEKNTLMTKAPEMKIKQQFNEISNKLSNLNQQMLNEMKKVFTSSVNVIQNNNSGGSSQSMNRTSQKGAHGPVGTRQSEPMLFELLSKKLKGSVT